MRWGLENRGLDVSASSSEAAVHDYTQLPTFFSSAPIKLRSSAAAAPRTVKTYN